MPKTRVKCSFEDCGQVVAIPNFKTNFSFKHLATGELFTERHRELYAVPVDGDDVVGALDAPLVGALHIASDAESSFTESVDGDAGGRGDYSTMDSLLDTCAKNPPRYSSDSSQAGLELNRSLPSGDGASELPTATLAMPGPPSVSSSSLVHSAAPARLQAGSLGAQEGKRSVVLPLHDFVRASNASALRSNPLRAARTKCPAPRSDYEAKPTRAKMHRKQHKITEKASPQMAKRATRASSGVTAGAKGVAPPGTIMLTVTKTTTANEAYATLALAKAAVKQLWKTRMEDEAFVACTMGRYQGRFELRTETADGTTEVYEAAPWY